MELERASRSTDQTSDTNRMTVVHMWFGNKIVVGVLKREVNDDASEAAILKCIKLGEDTESPKLGEETESPTIGEETKSPKLGKDTESPKMGEETGSPKLGEDTESPMMGEETKSPRMGEDTESPKLVSSKWLETKVNLDLCAN